MPTSDTKKDLNFKAKARTMDLFCILEKSVRPGLRTNITQAIIIKDSLFLFKKFLYNYEIKWIE